ncbi:SAM-dependent methyltransferase [Salinibacter altiplanensis]|uniref:SAM-dependent methyltransferase n=1 Tax=Salinibacter altiplanensis TaxID=1803181 RepID=UPI000C9FEC7E|nr:methyltransferase domain-containing protein [Salinibacter altiplanensis]
MPCFRPATLSLLTGLFVLSAALPQHGAAQTVDPLPPSLQEASLAESAVISDSDTVEKDAPYVSTSQRVVNQMLEAANVTSDDVVFDLGSGDGRIPIAAAQQHGARGVGVEIDPDLIAKARENAETAGVSDRVEFRQGDLFEADLSDATVVALYLWPEINVKLRPKLLRALDPGDRIVSHDFRMGDWEPDRVVDLGPGKIGEETVYLWVVPESIPEDLLDISDEVEVQ